MLQRGQYIYDARAEIVKCWKLYGGPMDRRGGAVVDMSVPQLLDHSIVGVWKMSEIVCELKITVRGITDKSSMVPEVFLGFTVS
jgi:hypothetical protein